MSLCVSKRCIDLALKRMCVDRAELNSGNKEEREKGNAMQQEKESGRIRVRKKEKGF